MTDDRRAQLKAIKHFLLKHMTTMLQTWEEEAESRMSKVEFCERSQAKTALQFKIGRQVEVDKLKAEFKYVMAYWSTQFDTYGAPAFIGAPAC